MTHRDIPRRQAKWITGTPARRNPQAARRWNALFRVKSARPVEALKKTTGRSPGCSAACLAVSAALRRMRRLSCPAAHGLRQALKDSAGKVLQA